MGGSEYDRVLEDGVGPGKHVEVDDVTVSGNCRHPSRKLAESQPRCIAAKGPGPNLAR